MTRWCGWQVPGWPVYACLLDEHGDEVKHRPTMLTGAAWRALVTMHAHGRTVHEVIAP